jgi:hypothetical protein
MLRLLVINVTLATIFHEQAFKGFEDTLQVRVLFLQGTKSSICVALWGTIEETRSKISKPPLY